MPLVRRLTCLTSGRVGEQEHALPSDTAFRASLCLHVGGPDVRGDPLGHMAVPLVASLTAHPSWFEVWRRRVHSVALLQRTVSPYAYIGKGRYDTDGGRAKPPLPYPVRIRLKLLSLLENTEIVSSVSFITYPKDTVLSVSAMDDTAGNSPYPMIRTRIRYLGLVFSYTFSPFSVSDHGAPLRICWIILSSARARMARWTRAFMGWSSSSIHPAWRHIWA